MSAARILAATLLALAAGTAAPAPAAAEDEPGPGADLLELSVSGDRDTWWRGVELRCRPAGGHHPRAAEACAAVERARGDLDALRGPEVMCAAGHDPVTATATGTWDGGPVAWKRTYPNACELEARTGPVFRF